MIETDNLRTASLYINNQLLSRGLLRDGQSIDFANPFMQDDEVGYTMGRIMSVVNDLILRRDARPPPSSQLPSGSLTLYSAMPNTASLCRRRCGRSVPKTSTTPMTSPA